MSSVDISILLTALVPAFLILRSIIGGIGDSASRRKVGMLWDTGSFWPRWFHPLGPTAYGPGVVEELRARLASHPPDVLAAHSQGSVIATVTISQSSRKPISFLTYGSPLGIIYSKVFPSVGVADLVRDVEHDMAYAADGRSADQHHWVNLWRDTDPLGGEAIPGLAANRTVALGDDPEEGTGHSQYELTKAYARSRVDALVGVEVPAGDDN